MESKRPNILWYCTDQQRYDTIRALGNHWIRTPSLDALSQLGVAFTHAFTQSPVCTPSRASFLTGRYPASHHVHRNGNSVFPSGETPITKLFARAGYDCGLIGKLHLAAALKNREPRTDDGYDTFLWSHHPLPERQTGNAYHDWLRDEKGIDAGELFASVTGFTGPGVPEEYHQTTWATEMAKRFVSQRRDKPWLLSINIFDPHPPFQPPKRYLERYDPETLPLPVFREADIARQLRFAEIPQQSLHASDPRQRVEVPPLPPGTPRLAWAHQPPARFDGRAVKAAYYAMIEQIDDCFGALMEHLRATGQFENTIVVFMSDHGEHLGDHGLLYKGCRFFEGLVRVPLIFSWPGQFTTNLISDALVELVDVAPTLLEAAGLPIPRSIQGRSLLPILQGRADPRVHKPNVVCEYNDSLGSTPLSTPVHASMYRDHKHKIVVYHDRNLGELFDLESDPGELDDLWDAPEATSLKSKLLAKHFDAMMRTSDAGIDRVAMG